MLAECFHCSHFRNGHCCRYGLIDDSDSDEEAMTSEQQIQGTEHAEEAGFQSQLQDEDDMQEGQPLLRACVISFIDLLKQVVIISLAHKIHHQHGL